MGLHHSGPKLRVAGRREQGKRRNELNVVVFVIPGAGGSTDRRRGEQSEKRGSLGVLGRPDSGLISNRHPRTDQQW